MKQTAVEWLVNELNLNEIIEKNNLIIVLDIINQAKAMEKEQITKAMMYALDEDGHTGDWKIKFVNEYYDRTFNFKNSKDDTTRKS